MIQNVKQPHLLVLHRYILNGFVQYFRSVGTIKSVGIMGSDHF